MRKIYLAFISGFFAISTFGQTSSNLEVRYLDASKNIFKITSISFDQPDQIVASLNKQLGLSDSDSFELISSSEDQLRTKHYRYQQYHNGIKVNGSQLLLHIDSAGKILVGSKLVRGIESTQQNALSEDEALLKALDYFDADYYYWEKPEMEAHIKEAKDDPEATYYPNGELVYAEKKSSQNGSKYSLNWKFEINGQGEKHREFVFVNASSGAISFVHNGIHTDAANGTAITRYHGEREIITDSTGPDWQNFILYDETRGNGGIHTYNMQSLDFDIANSTEFTDEDNFWDNDNTDMDEVAGDVHWGLEMTYDYYFNMHDRNSYNNSGVVINAYVHVGDNWSNASWNGTAMLYGDANNNPFTHITVAGHEFTHAVTGATANLVYQDESGALNESFSDIFGTAIWFYADEENAEWKIYANTNVLRSMENPNAYNDPDTYFGINWVTGDQDNGGVHTNSGVQNHWYYLLSEGGSGVNDNGKSYEVEGLGIEKASAIAYRNLAEHLTPTSGYEAARTLSIISAEELYGPCSEEVLQVIKAWYAVGLGSSPFFFDGEVEIEHPESGCNLSDSESLDMFFVYNEIIGCDNILVEGDTIQVAYTDNGGDAIITNIILDEDMQDWDELDLSIAIDLSAPGQHSIELSFFMNGNEFTMANVPASLELTNATVLEHDDNVGFEDVSLSPDSFYVSVGEHAEAEITSSADNTGTKGFRLTGYDAIVELIDWPTNEEENFTLNPEYNSEICFCVDATNWDEAQLVFDMKQLHSEFWNEYFGEDQAEFSSSMRIMVNGTQIGDQYHPTTYDDDPYLTHSVNLNEYAGTGFSVCFQSKNFLSNPDDPVIGSTGDNTYLDNIRFIDPTVGIDELSAVDFSVYPNPTDGVINVIVGDTPYDYSISIVDALGRQHYKTNSTDARSNSYEINLTNLVRGVYIIRIQSDNDILTKKVILQ